MNSIFEQVSFKKKVLMMLCISNVWIPLRRGLLRDCSNRILRVHRWQQGSLVARNNSIYETHHIDKLLPAPSSIIKFYYVISTGTHAINALINSILLYNSDSEMKRDGYLALIRCHSHRVVSHSLLSQNWVMLVGFCFSWLHLIFRFLVIVYRGELLLDPLYFLLLDKQELRELSDPKRALAIYMRTSTLDSIRRVLFYKMEDLHGNRVEFALKPGRSEKDYDVMKFMIDTCFNVAILCTMSGLLVAAAIGIYVFVTELDFLYPKCNIQDYNLAYFNRLFGSMNLTLIFVFDGFISVFFPIMVSIIVVFDLMVYWSQIASKLDTLAEILQSSNIARSQSSNYDRALARQFKSVPDPGGRKYDDINKRIAELQSLMGDFFGQVKRADQSVSLSLRLTFALWVGIHGLISFSGLRNTNRTTAYLTAFAQILFFLVMLIMSYLVLVLKRKTEPAYRILCSIMANDPSLDKKRWMVLLKYYTVSPRYAFTMVHGQLFSFGLFIKALSYTFTFALFVEKFRHQ